MLALDSCLYSCTRAYESVQLYESVQPSAPWVRCARCNCCLCVFRSCGQRNASNGSAGAQIVLICRVWGHQMPDGGGDDDGDFGLVKPEDMGVPRPQHLPASPPPLFPPSPRNSLSLFLSPIQEAVCVHMRVHVLVSSKCLTDCQEDL